MTNKCLISKIYKQDLHLSNNGTNNPILKMGRRPKQIFLQRSHTDGQQTHENMLNIANYCRHRSVAKTCLSLCDPRGLQHARLPSSTISQSLLKLTYTELVKPPHHLTLCRPLLLLPSFFLSTRVSSSESTPHVRWPNYWSFSVSPSNQCAVLGCSVVSDYLQPHKL